jgi:peptide deformylase
MAVLPIVEYPDPRLRRRAEPVTAFDADLARLGDDLLDTLAATGGIALSAPQIGYARRVVAIGAGDGPPAIYIDPQIVARSAPGLVEESCLSVPGVAGSVWRATRVEVRARDRVGTVVEHGLAGMAAVAMQHEIDHLDGILFIDRLWLVQRLLVRSRLAARARRSRGNAEEVRDVA